LSSIAIQLNAAVVDRVAEVLQLMGRTENPFTVLLEMVKHPPLLEPIAAVNVIVIS
jgi:hypothetical protein